MAYITCKATLNHNNESPLYNDSLLHSIEFNQCNVLRSRWFLRSEYTVSVQTLHGPCASGTFWGADRRLAAGGWRSACRCWLGLPHCYIKPSGRDLNPALRALVYMPDARKQAWSPHLDIVKWIAEASVFLGKSLVEQSASLCKKWRRRFQK